MKKKLIFVVATLLFAVATLININMLKSSSVSDISLENIITLAQANGENGGNEPGNKAQGSKTETIKTCVEFNFTIFKCIREKTTTITVPCCIPGTSTCSSSIDC